MYFCCLSHLRVRSSVFFWARNRPKTNLYELLHLQKLYLCWRSYPFRFESLRSVFWFIQLDKSLSQNIASNFWIIYLISTNQMSRLPNSLRPVFKSMLLSRSFIQGQSLILIGWELKLVSIDLKPVPSALSTLLKLVHQV